MKTIGISIKIGDVRAAALANELIGWLKEQQREVRVDASLRDFCSEPCIDIDDMTKHVNLMLVLGGDGTLLGVSRSFIGSDVPILGVNLGRLGFLTEAPVDNMFEAVSTILDGGGSIVRHFSLAAEVWRDGINLGGGQAINDVVLQRNRHPRMIEFEMRVSGQFVFRVRADGLVLATPAGSTAYALSAGGPIVHQQLDAILVAPVCPHTLSNRPIVLPSGDKITLRLTEVPAPAALNLDGQMHLELMQGDEIRIARSGTVSLAYLPGRNYFEVLRSKLHWTGRTDEKTHAE